MLTFTDLADGRSRLEGLSVFLSAGDRDAMLGGMDSGMDENVRRLDELIAADRGAADPGAAWPGA